MKLADLPRLAALAALALGAACRFPPPPDVELDAVGDDPRVDASGDGGGPECTALAVSCVGGNLSHCDADGRYVRHTVPNGGPGGTPVTLTMHDYPCPMGCRTSEPRCADIDAANGLNVALDSVPLSPLDLDLTPGPAGAPILIDTSSFDAGMGQTIITHPDPLIGNIAVPAEVITQTELPEILVLKVRSLSLRQGATVRATGARALAIVSRFDVYIAGTMDLSQGGAGRCSLPIAQTTATGGGGNYQTGSMSSSNAEGTATSTDVNLTPLHGGCAGVQSRVTGPPVVTTAGGAGGGALQLVSGTKLLFEPSAVIDVSGGGGTGRIASSTAIATGGGAGGSVLLEAPQISLTGGAIIAGRGGGGGAAHLSMAVMADGMPGTKDGPGAGASVFGATGGTGGSESAGPMAGTAAGGVAGGAGSVGKCVLRSRSGSISVPPGTLRLRSQTLPLPSR